MTALYVIIGLAVLGGIGYGLYYYFTKVKKKKVSSHAEEQTTAPKPEESKKPEENKDTKPSKEKVVVKLQAIKREKGTGLGGYETYQEAGARLAKLSKEEFEKLNVDDKPWGQAEWANPSLTEEKILERNKHEQGMLYRSLANGKEIPQHVEILTREFDK